MYFVGDMDFANAKFHRQWEDELDWGANTMRYDPYRLIRIVQFNSMVKRMGLDALVA